jgi:sialic acid synthase SpsE/sugar phosphate isomerase/epimerase
MIIKREISRYVVAEFSTIRAALTKIDGNEDGIVFCVADRGVLLGVLTDGDVRRWLIRGGPPDLERPVGSIINRSYVSAAVNDKPERIAALLRGSFEIVPLTDTNGCCVAMACKRKARIDLGNRKIGSGYPTFVVAEIGNNHQGELQMAKQLVDEAVKAGADCAKFQMRDLQSLYRSDGSGNDLSQDLGTQYTLDLLSRFQLQKDELFKIFDYCHEQGIQPLCTAWDLPSLAALESYGISGYKTASADFTNQELLKAIAQCGKPMICSTGMSTDAEIKQSINLLRRHGAQFALLQCNSTYPAPFKDINLRYMERLRAAGDCPVGYSSHDRGINISVAAVTLGASIIEKHFTLDRSLEGNDHRVSLLPGEFASMVEAIRQVELALGDGETREISQGELMNRETLGKSLFINTDLALGGLIRDEMLEVRSPGRGLQPNRRSEVVGKPVMRSLRRGDILYPSDLGGELSRPRAYHFKRPFGIPVRYHDLGTLATASNFDLLEFHLSYRDLEVEVRSFFDHQLNMDLVVHAPELFAGDHVLDLCSPDPAYRATSIESLQRVIDITRELRGHFARAERPRIVINAGGFTQDEPLPEASRARYYSLILDSLAKLDLRDVEIIPQSMPPFPWHFGGQRYQNLFVDPAETRMFCDRNGFRMCLDISHSKLACNHHKWSFDEFIRTVGPVTSHLHIADAAGSDGEGLQIGEGEIDFPALGRALGAGSPSASFIPEIWQGHKNDGQGFWSALDRLEPHL